MHIAIAHAQIALDATHTSQVSRTGQHRHGVILSGRSRHSRLSHLWPCFIIIIVIIIIITIITIIAIISTTIWLLYHYNNSACPD